MRCFQIKTLSLIDLYWICVEYEILGRILIGRECDRGSVETNKKGP